jgi:hypothetical protein
LRTRILVVKDFTQIQNTLEETVRPMADQDKGLESLRDVSGFLPWKYVATILRDGMGFAALVMHSLRWDEGKIAPMA